jgi:hypothetical protein
LAFQHADRFVHLLNAEVAAESGSEEIYLDLPARIDALNL